MSRVRQTSASSCSEVRVTLGLVVKEEAERTGTESVDSPAVESDVGFMIRGLSMCHIARKLLFGTLDRLRAMASSRGGSGVWSLDDDGGARVSEQTYRTST